MVVSQRQVLAAAGTNIGELWKVYRIGDRRIRNGVAHERIVARRKIVIEARLPEVLPSGAAERIYIASDAAGARGIVRQRFRGQWIQGQVGLHRIGDLGNGSPANHRTVLSRRGGDRVQYLCNSLCLTQALIGHEEK